MLCSLASAGAAAGASTDWPSAFAKTWRDTFASHWRDTKEYTLAMLEAMPAEHFGFKPVPAQRSFGEQFTHLAAANVVYFKSFAVLPPPERVEAADKDSARRYVTASFDFVASVLDKLTEKDFVRTNLQLWAKAAPHSGTDICLRAYMHTAHHRGQAVGYLRLKGITPPAWKFEPAGR